VKKLLKELLSLSARINCGYRNNVGISLPMQNYYYPTLHMNV